MFENLEIWWVTGAQLLYGGDAVVKVDAHSKEMVEGLNNSGNIPVKVVYKGTANSSNEVEAVMKAANNDEKCVGIITWMHTFSPAKMWIKGLQALQKPLLHFHTQYNAEIPWETMDMDFMNLNQSAHGDIEFGHICSRMRVPRKVVCGYWKSEEAQKKIAVWARVAAGVADARKVRCLMFGMNMNNVAVTGSTRNSIPSRLTRVVRKFIGRRLRTRQRLRLPCAACWKTKVLPHSQPTSTTLAMQTSTILTSLVSTRFQVLHHSV